MTKALIPRLRCIGVVPRTGYREYGFSIEDSDKALRRVVLTIADDMFSSRQLLFQEAPDLCYQKLLEDLGNETSEAPIRNRRAIGSSDVERYRGTHPAVKSSLRSPGRRSS